jgi:phosphomannomutase
MADKDTPSFDKEIEERIQQWLTPPFDETTRAEVQRLLKENPQELKAAFYKNLTFGTGGMRGIMGVGTCRLNIYTIRQATQGLAQSLQQEYLTDPISVFISYDSRHHSKEFAEEAAMVLAGNGIQVYLTGALRPTPLVSFGCRYKHCQAAIMITASHNPPEYNGYKVYWSDGGQVLPPYDERIMQEVAKVNLSTDIKRADTLSHPLIEMVGEDVDEAYLNALSTLPFYPDINKKEGEKLSIVYTSLHGTGITLAPPCLQRWGFVNIHFVEPQIIPDGDFPTTHSPNPEEKEALKLGISTLNELKGDILLANDPDADRVGVAVMHDGKPVILTGNQVACLCLEHICKSFYERRQIRENLTFIKTIVTTELFKAITDRYGVQCVEVLTGFKYIAQKMTEWETEGSQNKFIFGGEESLGYLLGTFIRDKDAVISSCLIAEAALQAKLQNKTLVDLLNDLYDTYGIYAEKLISVNFPDTPEGKKAMGQAMQLLRRDPFNEISSARVFAIDDYLISKHKNLADGKTSPLTLPKSDVLVYWLEGGGKLMVRPSGTEPKVKVYGGVLLKEYDTLEEGKTKANNMVFDLLEAVKELLISS